MTGVHVCPLNIWLWACNVEQRTGRRKICGVYLKISIFNLRIGGAAEEITGWFRQRWMLARPRAPPENTHRRPCQATSRSVCKIGPEMWNILAAGFGPTPSWRWSQSRKENRTGLTHSGDRGESLCIHCSWLGRSVSFTLNIYEPQWQTKLWTAIGPRPRAVFSLPQYLCFPAILCFFQSYFSASIKISYWG